MTERRKVSLRTIWTPPAGIPVVSAPPILIASTHTIDYTCEKCGTVLLHADDEQVHSLKIHCTNCGSYNSTDG